ncbi:hypothetical protein SNEBB_008537 [Seison nebaliae]|nr:hypothetical protein SNEBB_008537 [Seison nebaliae]
MFFENFSLALCLVTSVLVHQSISFQLIPSKVKKQLVFDQSCSADSDCDTNECCAIHPTIKALFRRELKICQPIITKGAQCSIKAMIEKTSCMCERFMICSVSEMENDQSYTCQSMMTVFKKFLLKK